MTIDEPMSRALKLCRKLARIKTAQRKCSKIYNNGTKTERWPEIYAQIEYNLNWKVDEVIDQIAEEFK